MVSVPTSRHAGPVPPGQHAGPPGRPLDGAPQGVRDASWLCETRQEAVDGRNQGAADDSEGDDVLDLPFEEVK